MLLKKLDIRRRVVQKLLLVLMLFVIDLIALVISAVVYSAS